MNRRKVLQRACALPLLPLVGAPLAPRVQAAAAQFRRCLPADPEWPPAASWERLNAEVGGRLAAVVSPLASCAGAPDGSACAEVFSELKNPYYIGDSAALTQTCGWVDGWTAAPSAYVVAARTTEDVCHAVNFARENRLRVVIKGGGHSYQGTSNAAGSLLIWTRAMNQITLHDAFVGDGCSGRPAQQAVTVGAGNIWMRTYHAVVTEGGRYVQGGGCASVGVAGLIQSGGFGSFSKRYGMAAASLLQAEIVTADGVTRIANACTNPDLFWALKGGGGGSFGVVTKLTLRTHSLPEFFGVVYASIRASSDAAFRRLIARFVAFYGDRLFNPHWGEQAAFRPDNTLDIAMLFQGIDKSGAESVWRQFFDGVTASPQDFSLAQPIRIIDIPARHLWDPEFLRRNAPSAIIADDRAGAPASNVFWSGNLGEAGQFLHGYESVWLPAALLRPNSQKRLVDALFEASRVWRVSLHFNKGLAGAPAEARAAARDTATNPAMIDAFALVIIAGGGPPAFPGIRGHEPDLDAARKDARRIADAMRTLRSAVPAGGSYVSEAGFFDPSWRRAYWGPHYSRLRAVKAKYDPDGLFIVHHGVGSENWTPDGNTRLGPRLA
jgi:FAD/FMN-containing dehydrogenase